MQFPEFQFAFIFEMLPILNEERNFLSIETNAFSCYYFSLYLSKPNPK